MFDERGASLSFFHFYVRRGACQLFNHIFLLIATFHCISVPQDFACGNFYAVGVLLDCDRDGTFVQPHLDFSCVRVVARGGYLRDDGTRGVFGVLGGTACIQPHQDGRGGRCDDAFIQTLVKFLEKNENLMEFVGNDCKFYQEVL